MENWNDKTYVMDALGKDGLQLSWIGNNLCDDKEIVLAAVNQNGMALEYAPRNFNNDKEVVIAAFNNNPSSLKYASDDLKQNEIFIKDILKNHKQNFTNCEKYSIPYKTKLSKLKAKNKIS